VKVSKFIPKSCEHQDVMFGYEGSLRKNLLSCSILNSFLFGSTFIVQVSPLSLNTLTCTLLHININVLIHSRKRRASNMMIIYSVSGFGRNITGVSSRASPCGSRVKDGIEQQREPCRL
jgi:hypothetical protein